MSKLTNLTTIFFLFETKKKELEVAENAVRAANSALREVRVFIERAVLSEAESRSGIDYSALWHAFDEDRIIPMEIANGDHWRKDALPTKVINKRVKVRISCEIGFDAENKAIIYAHLDADARSANGSQHVSNCYDEEQKRKFLGKDYEAFAKLDAALKQIASEFAIAA